MIMSCLSLVLNGILIRWPNASNFCLGPPEISKILALVAQIYSSGSKNCWLVGWFGFNSPLRQYFSLYWAVSLREVDMGEKG